MVGNHVEGKYNQTSYLMYVSIDIHMPLNYLQLTKLIMMRDHMPTDSRNQAAVGVSDL